MVSIKRIKAKDSVFGHSFGGKKKTDFFNIYYDGDSPSDYAGELEFDPEESEVLSIHVDSDRRGLGIGKDAIQILFEVYNIDKIYAWSAKSSLPFWRKVGKEYKKDHFVVEKDY